MARIGESADLLKCSFCGKSQKQVQQLIAGPGVYICDECVELCNEIMRMRTWLEETLAKHSNRSVEQVNKDIDRDKILSAAEALEYGLIDQVLTSRKSLPALVK